MGIINELKQILVKLTANCVQHNLYTFLFKKEIGTSLTKINSTLNDGKAIITLEIVSYFRGEPIELNQPSRNNLNVGGFSKADADSY